jgi:PhzF family phenazine biosynthesis protein
VTPPATALLEDQDMRVPIYQVDAFADRPFAGNPAAVCPLDDWLPDAVMQAIAAENNLSETAFVVPQGEGYGLRWFTPALEVDLCGHATLATAHMLFDRLDPDRDAVSFETRSGRLTVTRHGDRLEMDFPALPVQAEVSVDDATLAGLGARPVAAWTVRRTHGAPFRLALFASQADVAALAPDFGAMTANVIATAPGDELDFVSRFFAPRVGVPEDPVTGSAHCTLAPFWAERLGRTELRARQISARGGDVGCRLDGDRVLLSGRCVCYMEGHIELAG